ncbi:MAG: ATP-binding protein [Microbacterium sp.]|uniref:sensor histidine kinase n=1 Tax=Microbacterium sp. TaxID=51671 RepID=UPI0039E56D02
MTKPAPVQRSRRPLSLQTRLIATVIAIVALLLVVVAVATSTILGGVLKQNLDAQIASTARSVQIFTPGLAPQQRDAYDALSHGRQPYGFLLMLRTDDGATSGAVVGADGVVIELTSTQEAELEKAIDAGSPDVTLTGLGAYRVTPVSVPDTPTTGLAGLPLSEVNATIATMLLTVGVVTAGGLLLLAVAIAIVIRLGLRPLRAVAATATRVASLPLDQGSVSIAERVPPAEADERTEVGRVGAALNTLLDHVDSSLDARQRNEERMRRFVADASHELRTPLASIRGYSELSLRALRNPRGSSTVGDDTESALERIQAQSLRMTTLVEDLLLLARLDEGQELVYGAVDLTQLVIEAVGDARPAGPDHTWRLDIGPDPVVVAGDTTRLHQVVANLLANARTHTPAGTTVRVSVERDGADAVLRVRDDGPGIDPAVADELFERFSRADRSRARKTGGSGLGLSIARAIVGAHHGAISVDSVPGDTVFTVRLPARPAEPSADEPAAASAPA